jgi:hypothetical protein
MSSTAKLSIIIGLLSFSQLILAPATFGQGRRGGWGGRGGGGGDDSRGPGGPGGDRGGPGGGPGGDRGPGGGRFGGGNPGDDLASRLARVESSLKNIDSNGNGVIDADEAKDPMAKGQLDRIFMRIGKEPHYPMSISEILQSYEAAYKARAASNGGGPTPGAPSSGPAHGATTPTTSVISPPVMGFGSPTPPASGGSSSGFGMGRPAAPVVSQANLITPTSETPAPSGRRWGSFGPPQSPPSADSAADAKPAPRRPNHLKPKRDALPKGLPDWFLKMDVNGDGQITMAQFATNWTPDKVKEFDRYDLNHDGIITAAECLKVEKEK